MSREYKGHVKMLLIYSKYMACRAVQIGIIGRLGKIFGVGLNFFYGKTVSFRAERITTRHSERSVSGVTNLRRAND